MLIFIYTTRVEFRRRVFVWVCTSLYFSLKKETYVNSAKKPTLSFSKPSNQHHFVILRKDLTIFFKSIFLWYFNIFQPDTLPNANKTIQVAQVWYFSLWHFGQKNLVLIDFIKVPAKLLILRQFHFRFGQSLFLKTNFEIVKSFFIRLHKNSLFHCTFKTTLKLVSPMPFVKYVVKGNQLLLFHKFFVVMWKRGRWLNRFLCNYFTVSPKVTPIPN